MKTDGGRTRKQRQDRGAEKRFLRVVDFAQVMQNYHFADSKRHNTYVRYITKVLCLRYNTLVDRAIPEEEQRLIYAGAMLHDIGLISVPDALLHHKWPLPPEEHAVYERHTQIGASIIEQMSEIYHLTEHEREVLHDICMYHHERYDGGGYPMGLKGDEIPLCAQLVSLAEVYDSLTADNYSRPRSHEEALELIMAGECGVFNPRILECLERSSADLQAALECKDDQERFFLLYNAFGINRKSYWRKKRAMDIAVSALGLLVLSPVMLLIALIIWLDDPAGSPIFRQTRVGRHKKEFTMYKFRTMHMDAEMRLNELQKYNEKDGPVFKIANDPRITRVGGFLRKTSLDELPQLVNVLKGDMTLVGPRPPLPREVEQYSRYAEMRLSITPGLTCHWQTHPQRDEISFDEWMDMDIAYIGTRSIKQDVRMLFRTLLTMLRRSGH